mgnify:CR=1 FL=1
MEPFAGTVRKGSRVTYFRLLGAAPPGLPDATLATAPNYPSPEETGLSVNDFLWRDLTKYQKLFNYSG